MLDPRYAMAREKLSRVARVLLVCSGKGGVGKSVVAASLALALADKGRRVGLLDLDLHGPSAPIILGLRRVELRGSREGLKPVSAQGVEVMSIAFYAGEGAIAVRGEAKEGLVLNMLAETCWSPLDYLVVDMPPGMGEVTIAAVRVLGEGAGALIVTTPSSLAILVVKRLIDLLRSEQVPVIGVVENMAYMDVEGRRIEVFGPSRAGELGLPLLGRIPLDPDLETALSRGKGPKAARSFWRAIMDIARRVEEKLSVRGRSYSSAEL